ncbi:MAG: hypothetical protein M3498_05505 [Deinococcota bacterium]|nr:hypothetical protein [Deinococcota bacterium]
MRRISEKSEKKKEREKADKRAARLAKVSAKRESRRTVTKPEIKPSAVGGAPSETRPGEAGRPRNRFIGVLALVNVLVVSYGAFLAPAEPTLADTFMNGLLYITLGYFACRWFLGRGLGRRALYASVFSGLTLALGLELAKVFLDGLQPYPLNLLFVLPALLLGAFGGVFIERKLHGA